MTGATCAGEGNVGEGRVALWDVRTRRGVVSQLTTPCGLIPSVSFCAYSSGIAAGGSDGVVRVYDMRRFTTDALHEVRIPVHPVSAFASAAPAFSPASSLAFDLSVPLDSLSLTPPSTSPPSPSVVGSPMSSSTPSRRHIQSVCLLPDRLIALQSSALTLFASSGKPPRKTSTFPFAYPVHSLTLSQMTQATHAGSSHSATGTALSTPQRLTVSQQQQHSPVQQPTHSKPADTRLVAMQTADAGDTLALSTTDCLVVWGASQAQREQHSVDGDYVDDTIAESASQWARSAGMSIPAARPAIGGAAARQRGSSGRSASAGSGGWTGTAIDDSSRHDGEAGRAVVEVDGASTQRRDRHSRRHSHGTHAVAHNRSTHGRESDGSAARSGTRSGR